ncbi:DEAD/DEAH box helicase [Atopobacter phocae]|uniref:DEAD/DEAH box helicase n=1 Tax=Atopobacter phocae TaxID=136492 RepID=UPI00046EB304|nr:SNF2-related protein [Atopobacter phocae]
MKWSVPDHLIESAKQLVEEKRIVKIGAAKDFPAFFAQVIDDRNYRVQIDGTGKEEDTCQCAYWQAHHFCVHTVAVELELRQRIGRRYWMESDHENSVFESIEQSINLNELLLIKSRFNSYHLEHFTQIETIPLHFTSDAVVYGGIDASFILTKLDFLPQEISTIEFLEKLVHQEYIEPILRFKEETMNHFRLLGQLVLKSNHMNILNNSKRYRHHLVIDSTILPEFLEWAKQVNQKNLQLSITFEMNWMTTPIKKPFNALVNDQVQMQLETPYQLDLNYRVMIMDQTWYRLTYQQMETLRILGELAHGTYYGKRLHVSSGPKFTLGERQSSMVQAVWPLLKDVANGIPSGEQVEELTIQIDGRFDEHQLYLEVFFEYGDEMSYPIILEEPRLQLIVWRSIEELAFFEQLMNFGATYQDHQFIFSGRDVADRWKISHEILPYLRQHEFNLRASTRPTIDQVKMRPKINERGRYLSIEFETDDLDQSQIKLLTDAIATNQRFVEIEPFQFIAVDASSEQEVNELIDELHLKRSTIQPVMELPMIKLPLIQRYLERVDKDAIATTSSFDWLLHQFQNQEAESITTDLVLQDYLKPYQIEGVKWLKRLNDWHMGGILADEMGLGKTIQMLSLIATQYADERFQPSDHIIICCPASLVDNWLDEIKRFVPELSAIAYRGQPVERMTLLKDNAQYQILIMSYQTFLQDHELFFPLDIASVVLDEAQYVKNDRSKTHHALMKWTDRPIYALSGTPIENKMDELWALIQLVIPGLFESKKHFEITDLNEIRRLTAPFFLRREKSQVLFDLPELIEEDQLVPLSTFERSLYVSQLDAIKVQMAEIEGKNFGKYRFSILAGLTRLRQICCHPGLVTKEWTTPSSKYMQITHLLQENPTDQWLIFSQFASGLPYLANFLKDAGYRVFILDGKTPMNLRQKMVDDFNVGHADVFIISLKAGGTGLNLTGANRVILLDLWWNPAVESQAFARAHRLGQKKDVHVYRLIAEGTIEEEIRELQSAKRSLFNEIVADQDEVISLNQSLTDQELRQLFLE